VLPADALADTLQPFAVQIGCNEADCVCVLYPNQKPTWTEWQPCDAPERVI